MSKCRADELLIRQNPKLSRSQAQALIMAGQVRLSTGERIDKAGRTLPENTVLHLEQLPQFVSRGGDKLAGFLDHFQLDVTGLRSLDVGASTGGFTDCLLQRGVTQAVCVDVGHGQLHYKLQRDPRVISLEKVNARHLTCSQLPYPSYSIVVMDLSFISLTKVLPAVWPLVQPDGILIALIKPQFEASKEDATAGKGIIKDPSLHQSICQHIQTFCQSHLTGAQVIGLIPSPITGTDGNQEFLIGLRLSTTHST